MNKKIIFRGIILIVVIGAAYRMFISQPEYTLTHVTGTTMGTIQYNVKYLGDKAPSFKKEFDSILVAFNQSMSTYIPTSEISVLNQTDILDNPSDMFMDVLNRSKVIYETTDGAFDPTVGPLVSAWGFGADKKPTIPDSAQVDSLMMNVGFSKIDIGSTVRLDSAMYLDFSAIAKGYAVDLIGEYLESKEFYNYMVEIGGEVRSKGVNEKGEIWKIGIEDPIVAMDERKLLAIVHLKDMSMATSGNYRSYYQLGDRTIAHTIDPRTGYNTHHTLLSASVFAEDCMTADAYATAFMVLGVEGSKEILNNSNLEGFLIYHAENGSLKSFVSEGIEPLLEFNKLDSN